MDKDGGIGRLPLYAVNMPIQDEKVRDICNMNWEGREQEIYGEVQGGVVFLFWRIRTPVLAE